MGIFSGKKALCFIALPHHNRFLVPIMEALRERGMQTSYFTTAAEGAFEITLNQANLPYRHVLDYAAGETIERTRAAYNELRPVLQEKILSNYALQSVPVVIQDKVIRSAVENFCCLDRMLEVEKPDLLFALHELNPWGKILGYLSHVHRIPYFTLQEGLYYADIHYYRFHTDYSTACLVWGEDCREILLRAGCGDDKVFPVGNTHIWNAKEEFTNETVVRETRASLGIGPEQKIILFLMSHSHYQPFDARIFLQWMKARGDAVAVFKWHPVTGKEIVDRALDKMRDHPAIRSVHGTDTYALIGASDVCVTVGNSTTGLEALVFGKPLLEVRLADQDYSFAEQGVAEPAVGFEDIGAKCDAILSQGLSESRRDQVKGYLAHNFAYQDGQTMERIVGLVEESLKANGEKERAPLPSPDWASCPCSILLPVSDAPPATLLATLQGISTNITGELFEVVIVNCAAGNETNDIINSLGGDVKIIPGKPDWSYSEACNRAATEAHGKYLVFLKPGLVPETGWLEGLLRAADEEGDLGVVGGMLLNKNNLLWHIGIAFDVNQGPFSIYRMLPPAFSGVKKRREFGAVEFPFLVGQELFCRLGGLNTALCNRFEDIDFCLRVKQTGLRVLYAPESRIIRKAPSWEPNPNQDRINRIHFYSRWTGSLWQDDAAYLQEDGLTHDALSALYRDFAGRLRNGAAEQGVVAAAGPA